MRKDYAQLHSGAECAEAMSAAVFSRTNANDAGWDAIVSDHGERLYSVDVTGSKRVGQGTAHTH